MTVFHPQYVVDEKSQRQAVIVSVAEWEQILEKLEELDDIRVGCCRVVYEIQDDRLVVLVVATGDRRDVYR